MKGQLIVDTEFVSSLEFKSGKDREDPLNFSFILSVRDLQNVEISLRTLERWSSYLCSNMSNDEEVKVERKLIFPLLYKYLPCASMYNLI